VSSLKKFKVTIPYFDSGTKKDHTVDFFVDAKDPATAVVLAREKFDSYEKSSHASWVRIIRDDGIRVEEK